MEYELGKKLDEIENKLNYIINYLHEEEETEQEEETKLKVKDEE